MIRSVVVGCGSYLPERILTNADLEKMVDTTDEWIQTRTGIRERRILWDKDKATSYMAIEAAKDFTTTWTGASLDSMALRMR